MIMDPLGGMLFVLAQLCGLCPTIVAHLTCVFPSLVDDTHIVGLTSYVVLALL
jgi:hypothetical protein